MYSFLVILSSSQFTIKDTTERVSDCNPVGNFKQEEGIIYRVLANDISPMKVRTPAL